MPGLWTKLPVAVLSRQFAYPTDRYALATEALDHLCCRVLETRRAPS